MSTGIIIGWMLDDGYMGAGVDILGTTHKQALNCTCW
jgi:hypothetical protein